MGPIELRILQNMDEKIFDNINRQIANIREYIENECDQFPALPHALMNDLVLDNILRFLSFNNIRRFRQVCRKWNSISGNLFWKLAKIKIECPFGSCASPEEKHLMESFEIAFPWNETPSKTIEFGKNVSYSVVNYFLKQKGILTLKEIYFRAFYEPNNISIDLNHCLGTNIVKLDIRNSPKARFTVSFKHLRHIPYLYLENCRILLDEKIIPKELSLTESNDLCHESVLFSLDEYYPRNVPKILINDFVDLSKINKLCLHGNILRLDVTKNSLQMENLDLKYVQLIGLKNSLWKTKCFHINGPICSADVKMSIKSVSFVDSINVDLQSLPNSLEKLTLFIKSQQLNLPQTFFYPNLKHLSLSFKTPLEFPIFDFTNCDSLTDFELSVFGGIYKMDLTQVKLPNSIKRLKLTNVNVSTDIPWHLETLVLDNYSFPAAKNICSHCNTEKIVLGLNFALVDGVEQQKSAILKFWKVSNIRSLVVGNIKWSVKNPAMDSEFSKSVDKPGHYFLFNKQANEKGKAIDFEYFHKLCHF